MSINPSSDISPNKNTTKHTILSSTIAWVKFLATNPHRNTLSVWDTTWENAWNKEWARAWDDEWNTRNHSTTGLKALFGKTIKPNVVNARASGHTAGRAPTDFKHITKIIVGDQVLQTEGGASQTHNACKCLTHTV